MDAKNVNGEFGGILQMVLVKDLQFLQSPSNLMGWKSLKQ